MKFFFLSFLMLFLTNGCRDAQEELRAQALRDRQVITDLKDSKWEKVEMRLGNDQWHSSAEISKIAEEIVDGFNFDVEKLDPLEKKVYMYTIKIETSKGSTVLLFFNPRCWSLDRKKISGTINYSHEKINSLLNILGSEKIH